MLQQFSLSPVFCLHIRTPPPLQGVHISSAKRLFSRCLSKQRQVKGYLSHQHSLFKWVSSISHKPLWGCIFQGFLPLLHWLTLLPNYWLHIFFSTVPLHQTLIDLLFFLTYIRNHFILLMRSSPLLIQLTFELYNTDLWSFLSPISIHEVSKKRSS